MPEAHSETSVVEREIRIEAGPETVFPFFTDPKRMVRWMGLDATLDPRPGGVFSFSSLENYAVEGEYVAVEPPSRVVFTWGFSGLPGGRENPLPPGVSTVEVELVPDDEATLVRLTHTVPSVTAEFHTAGWDNYLPRLAVVATGGDPGPDPFLERVRSLIADGG